jgi:hypothetical protein
MLLAYTENYESLDYPTTSCQALRPFLSISRYSISIFLDISLFLDKEMKAVVSLRERAALTYLQLDSSNKERWTYDPLLTRSRYTYWFSWPGYKYRC